MNLNQILVYKTTKSIKDDFRTIGKCSYTRDISWHEIVKFLTCDHEYYGYARGCPIFGRGLLMYWVNCHEACNWCSKNPTISHHITETRRARENHYVRMARTVDSSRGYKRYFVCLNVISTIVVKIKKYNAFLPFSIKKGINCISLCWSLPETTLGWNAIVLKKLVCWKSGANQDT